MSPLILDGKAASTEWLEFLKPLVESLDPKLTVVQVGNDPASTSYIRQKTKSCDAIGMRHEHRHLEENISLKELFSVIEELNTDDDTSGFIVQLPLPSHLQEHVPEILRAIDPMKDVDGFTAYNLGKVFLSKDFEHLPPATPAGVIWLLDHYDIPVKGKHAVVVGHSNTVGKPLATMLLNRDATVTSCHIHTDDLAKHTREADILCTAVGKPGLIDASMVKDGAVVIDIGITRTDDGLKGDVVFEDVSQKASAITPVPGGVGPMTVASLMRNCVTARERQMELR